jgi:hypothetical protein
MGVTSALRGGGRTHSRQCVAPGFPALCMKAGVDALYRANDWNSYTARPTRIGIPSAGRSVTRSFGSGT